MDKLLSSLRPPRVLRVIFPLVASLQNNKRSSYKVFRGAGQGRLAVEVLSRTVARFGTPVVGGTVILHRDGLEML